MAEASVTQAAAQDALMEAEDFHSLMSWIEDARDAIDTLQNLRSIFPDLDSRLDKLKVYLPDWVPEHSDGLQRLMHEQWRRINTAYKYVHPDR